MSNEITAQIVAVISEKMAALFVTLLLMAGLLVWGVVTHFCCGFRHRRQIRREESARNLSTFR